MNDKSSVIPRLTRDPLRKALLFIRRLRVEPAMTGVTKWLLQHLPHSKFPQR